MSTVSHDEAYDLVVADDGSIPAEQLARLGAGPGSHLRVVPEQSRSPANSVAGRLAGWPELTWDDFSEASRLAQAELHHS